MAPLSDCEVRDPRIRRTRQLLQGALESLMRTRSFEEISVQEIAEEATVNRATFYDHYTDKFALLDALIAGGFHRILNERQVSYDGGCPSQASALIATTCDYLAAMHSSGRCAGQNPFEPLVDSAIIGAIRKVLTRSFTQEPKAKPLGAEMAATAASAAIYGAAKEWHRDPDAPSVEEITPKILALILPMLQNLPHPSMQESESPLAATRP
jgi:AcrR family transcriptional regulator